MRILPALWNAKSIPLGRLFVYPVKFENHFTGAAISSFVLEILKMNADKQDTKERILAAGSEIVHSKGFHHTGIQEILKSANVPKGSFYFYFKNKEDFGLQLIDYFDDIYEQIAQPILNDTSNPPLERIRNLLEFFITLYESFDFTLGCPIGNLAQEMGDVSQAFQKKLKESMDMMVMLYFEVLNEAKEKGDLNPDLDIRSTAEFIISSWHGALIRMKIEKSARPLLNHIQQIFDKCLK